MDFVKQMQIFKLELDRTREQNKLKQIDFLHFNCTPKDDTKEWQTQRPSLGHQERERDDELIMNEVSLTI